MLNNRRSARTCETGSAKLVPRTGLVNKVMRVLSCNGFEIRQYRNHISKPEKAMDKSSPRILILLVGTGIENFSR
jgi:hypothetical protein